ncbi:methyl-accepting chemotaxis protein [Psychromonas sp. Urea-02u-13]|uniref:methyl-accepting chemotaxis protein n=1 Tax=Psychromonas sp. Urea-02u-13 TaxID=2058326 RepID=UPI000C3483EC|nr:methyl-accepting chemotaxis protein [Psychromonas sp. Urea-02u-13]PKG39816.1 methyl-accepting chemotaxis protein [Psychromonas sp. Urea-02u-13]
MEVFNKFSIAYRLALAGVIAFLGVFLVSLQAVSMLNTTLMDEKSTQTKNLVESAHSVINSYYLQYQAGDISEEQAKVLAMNSIKQMRYAEGNYFWINDLIPKMIMHPIKPALDGKNLSQVKDANGKYLFVAFAKMVSQQGAGNVDYLWAKPGHEDPVAKISYVKGFKPWGWVIGTGTYTDDADDILGDAINNLLIEIVIITLLLILAIYLMNKSIVRPIVNTTRALAELAKGDGDLTMRLPIKGKDEIAHLSTSFNDFVDKIHGIIVSVQDSSNEVVRSSSALVEKSQSSLLGAQEQNAETAQIATASTEMVSTISEIANSATTAENLAKEANKETLSGKEVVHLSAQSIEQLSAEIKTASAVIDELDEQCASIDSVLSVIKAIAEQTNLLALNAAIEAARAGEQGRGFAVVADEVRTLAGRTQSATLEINGIIDQLQVKAKSAVVAIGSSSDKAQDAVEQALKASDSLDSIFASITAIADANHHIATAAEQQSSVTREIDERVVAISDLANQSDQIASDIHQESERINQLGCQVNGQMSTFKV